MSEPCSVLAAAEPLAGTAPRARWWWLVEVPGSWGRKAVQESRVPGLGALASPAPGPEGPRRVVLVRRPGRHPATADGPVRVWISGTHPADPPTRVAWLDDPAELQAWDPFDPPVGRLEIDPGAPTLAVCTNAKRDACCGIEGRRLISSLSEFDDVWECSHLGGHRFAPTALHLPSGMVYGRLTASDACAILDGRTPWTRARGNSALTPPAQVAQVFLGDQTVFPGDWTVNSLSDDEVIVTVRRDQVSQDLRLTRTPLGSRPPSCGGELERAWAWTVHSPRAAAN